MKAKGNLSLMVECQLRNVVGVMVPGSGHLTHAIMGVNAGKGHQRILSQMNGGLTRLRILV